MSLAVDASSPTAAIGSGPTTVTGAFTPPDNTLLVAFCAGDANNGSLDEDQTVVDSTSTTWTKVVLRNGNGGACVTVHKRRLSGTGSSPGSITATLTDSKGSVAKRIFPRVFVDVATGIAPDIGATAVSGSASVSLTTTVNNSWVWSIALTANAVLTAGTGCTQQDDFGGFDTGDAVQTESQTALTTTSGTSVTNGLSGTATVPHNIAVEIIPGSAGGASTTPGPTVVSTPATRPVPPAPILLRSTLQDPPVLTTPQPIVVSPAARPVPGAAAVLRSPLLADAAVTPQPIVVTSTRPAVVPPGLMLRATLADPPTLMTPQPVVVTAPARVVPGTVMTLRSTLADAVVVSGTPTPGAYVVGPIPKPVQVPPVLLLRSTLADPIPQTTPGPYVVSATARAAVTRPILLRSSLADQATGSPYVVTTTVRASINPVLLLRAPAAPAVTAGVTTVQPYVVTGQPARVAGTVLILAGQAGGACDCTTHRPNTGVTARANTGTTMRPNTGTTVRPCTC